VKDLRQDAGAGRSSGLVHDVFDMFLHSLLADGDRVRNLLVCPSLHEVLNHFRLAHGQLKSFSGDPEAEFLPAPNLLEKEEYARGLNSTGVRQTDPGKKNGVDAGLDDPAELKLLPVFRLCTDAQLSDDLGAELMQARR